MTASWAGSSPARRHSSRRVPRIRRRASTRCVRAASTVPRHNSPGTRRTVVCSHTLSMSTMPRLVCVGVGAHGASPALRELACAAESCQRTQPQRCVHQASRAGCPPPTACVARQKPTVMMVRATGGRHQSRPPLYDHANARDRAGGCEPQPRGQQTFRLDRSLYCIHGEVIRLESLQVSSRSNPVACRRPHRNQGANKSCCCLPGHRGTAVMVFKDRDRLLVCVGASQSACVRAALRSFWRCLACLRSFLALRLLVPFPPTLLLL